MRESVFTPKTKFSLDRSAQAVRLDVHQVYQQQQQQQGQLFAVLDGPPYANGNIHLGHVINKIQKDIINQIAFMQGNKVIYIQGSDCHGLPIEKAVEKALGADYKHLTALEIRKHCRDFANHWISIQNKQFAELGVFADGEKHFKTMDNALSIVKKFHDFVRKGQVYKGVRPIMWSIAERTSMATAEIEYKMHQSTAIDLGFPVKKSDLLPVGARCVIWTTTPWTIPANRAIAYKDSIEYVLVETEHGELVVAEKLLDQLLKRIQSTKHKILSRFKGSALAGTICAHPLAEHGFDFDVPLLAADYVTDEDGTGLVHTAPAHGEEDFATGQKYGLEITDIVGDDGTFQNVPVFDGMSFKKATQAILDMLPTLSKEQFAHSYPYSWRSHTPLIYKVTPQWYLKLNKEKALEFAREITWIPQNNRFESMLTNRSDWCVSRQRVWGTPLALFTENGKAVFDEEVLSKTEEYLTRNGVDSWFSASSEDILGHNRFEKCMDTLDVWFDAGCMQYCMKSYAPELPAQVDCYLEGSDQHRGFFQACLLVNDSLPTKTIITHGFILDGKGKKMSKSLGNVVSPDDVIAEYGIDVMRLWVALTDCSDDIRYSKQQMDKTKLVYGRFRNTLRYLLACLEDDIDPRGINITEKIDQALLNKFYSLATPDKYQSTGFYKALYDFCDQDLSRFYFDINKDIVYCDSRSSSSSKCAQGSGCMNRCDSARSERCPEHCDKSQASKREQVLEVYRILATNLIRYLTPVLKVMCKELGDLLGKNVFIERFADSKKPDHRLVEFWQQCHQIKDAANESIEPLRAEKLITQTWQAELNINMPYDMDAGLVQFITMTGKVSLAENDSIHIDAKPFISVRCERCRRYFADIESMCSRCQNVCSAC